MVTKIVVFIVGAVAGILIHRFIMALVLEKSPDTICAYCEWMGRKDKHRKL